MLQSFRNTVFIRSFWGFMCLFLFNCSVDIPDKRLNQFAVDLTINDQESIVEIIIEKVLGYGDVFLEFQEGDSNEHSKGKKNISLDSYVLPILSNDDQSIEVISKRELIYFKQQNLISAYFEIHSPPPEV